MVAYALSPVSSDFQRVLCEDDLNVVHLHVRFQIEKISNSSLLTEQARKIF